MTRKKVKLAFITNDSSRKATFKKRKKGLLKKVNELSTLCGIEACLIIYSPYDARPEVWPSPMGAQRILAEFKRMPEMEQSKKMVNQESFIRQRIAKASDQLKKLRKENREKEVTQVMFDSLLGNPPQNLNMMDLNDLNWLIDQNLKEIYRRMDVLQKEAIAMAGGQASGSQVEVVQRGVVAADMNAQNESALMMQNQMNINGMQREQWFGDIMTPQEQMPSYTAEDMVMPFMDNNNQTNIWSNTFFP